MPDARCPMHCHVRLRDRKVAGADSLPLPAPATAHGLASVALWTIGFDTFCIPSTAQTL
jgi:CRISPR-associated Cas5-like protein